MSDGCSCYVLVQKDTAGWESTVRVHAVSGRLRDHAPRLLFILAREGTAMSKTEINCRLRQILSETDPERRSVLLQRLTRTDALTALTEIEGLLAQYLLSVQGSR